MKTKPIVTVLTLAVAALALPTVAPAQSDTTLKPVLDGGAISYTANGGITIVSQAEGFVDSTKTKFATTHLGTTLLSYDATGADKLVIAIGTEAGFNGQSINVTGLTFDGVAFTQIVEERTRSGDGGTAEIWYLDNPFQGSGTFTFTYASGGGGVNGGHVSIIGLSGTAAGAGGIGATAAAWTNVGPVTSRITTTANGSLVVALVENSGTPNAAGTPNVQAPLTLGNNGSWGSQWGGTASGYQFVPVVGTTITPTFTANTGAGYSIHTVAVEFKAPVPTQYWDLNGDTAGAGGPAATNTWNGSTTNWNPKADGTDPTVAWSPGSTAVFAAGTDATGAYTVTVDGTPDITGLSFEEGAVTLTNGTALRLTDTTLAYVAEGLTATVATPLSDDAGGRELVKVGAGTLVLSGANSYSGATSVAQGTLVLSGDNSAAAGGMAVNGGVVRFESPASINGTARNVTNNAGGVVVFGPSFGAGNIPSALSDRIAESSAGVIAADNYAGTDFDFHAAGLTAAYLGAVDNVTYTGTLTPNGTTYRLGGGGGMLAVSNTNAVTGAGHALIVNGNVTLASANDHTGGTTLSAGTLIIGDAGALGSGAFTIAGAGTVQAAGTIVTANPVAADSDFTVAGSGALTLGDMTLSANRSITVNNTATTTTFGAIGGAGTSLAFSGNGNTAVTGVIGTGAGALTKNGTGTLTLWATNSYTGATSVNAGTLSVGKLADGGQDSAIGASGNADTSLLLGNGATLRYTGAGDSTDRRFKINGAANGQGATLDASGAGPVNFTNTTGPTYGSANQTRTLNLVGANTGANTLAASIGNNGTAVLSVVKDGAGTWVLSGANSYTGATTIRGGTLRGVTGGSCAGSAVTVNNTPGGTAALGVHVTDNTLQWTCASLAFNASDVGAQLQFSFAVAPTTLAPLNIAGSLTFNGAPEVVVDPTHLAGGVYPLLVVGGTAPSVVPAVSVPGYTGSRLFWGGTDNKTLFYAHGRGGTTLIVR